MKKKLDLTDLIEALAAGRIVPLPVERWRNLAGAFTVVETIPTGLAGDILLVRRPVPGGRTPGWALVEQSKPDERVVRPLPGRKQALALAGERLAAYERMWDG
ncbi:hypothetical protein KJ682_13165 [bacterium]|nr:hypothetical protein [bacterium]